MGRTAKKINIGSLKQDVGGSDGPPPEVIKIRSADDAWALLRAALDNQPLPDRISLVFDGWPNFNLKISGKDWHGTVPTRVMAPLLEVQRDLHRAYVTVCYDTTSLNRLKAEDRDLLELVVKVNKGSSDYEASMSKQLTELAKKAVDKMNSRDIVIMVLGIALTLGGNEFGKAWLAARQVENQAEQTVELSKQETERLKIFAEAVAVKPVLAETQADVVESQNRLLKAVKPGDEITISGVVLDSVQVADVVQQDRARAEDIDITGVFRVLANDTTKHQGFQIKVARIEDGLTFTAMVPLELDIAQQRLIQKAEWSKGATLVRLSITASLLRNAVTGAKVYSAEVVE